VTAWAGHAPGCDAGDEHIVLGAAGHARCASCSSDLELQPCETCGGDEMIDVDRYDGRGEHYTERRPCPDCVGSDGDDAPEADDW
jgi:hypothetical protein